MERVQLLNGEFDPLTLSQTVDAIFEGLHAGKKGWLATVNVSILMMMRADPWLQKFVDRAALVVADGQPLIWFAPWLHQALPERVTGVDLVHSLCQRAEKEGKRIYLLGGTKPIVTQLADRLRAQYPALQLGFDDGYFNKEQAPVRAEAIQAFGADILLVGMGVPRQERFIDEQWQRLDVGMAIGVGGSFDVLAGLRTIGMEWFFRLVQEPRRLFARYLTTNSLFLWLILRAVLQRKSVSR
jgi:N-acetylglucosaminyldiphosphoundecaprenol N-acetyl-beta-D-mannosaminyltransferase